MTRITDLDRQLATWMEAEATAPAPPDLIARVTAATSKRRPRPSWLARLHQAEATAGPARSAVLVVGLAVLTVAMLGLALAAGGALRGPDDVPPAIVTPAPSASASAPPSAGPSEVPPAVDATLRGRWMAAVGQIPALGNGPGPISFTIGAAGLDAAVANLAPGATFAGTIEAVDGDQVRLVLAADGGGCAAGDEGTYRWSLSDDGALLTLQSVSEGCSTRGDVLGRTWVRSLTAPASRGSGLVDAFDPWFTIALPDRAYEPRQLDDFVEIASPDGTSLMAWKNPQGFADPCSQASRYPWAPGADALVAYFRQNPAFTVLEATGLQIDGHRAIHLVIEGTTGPDAVSCPGDELLLFTPKGCDCHFVSGPGVRESFYLVEVDGDTIALEISPVGTTESERPVIGSIRIPAVLPSQ
jgi:hypothetical protein